MKIVVASTNPAKLEAARRAFAAVLSAEEHEISGLAVDSGVKEQPDSDGETRQGAINRAAAARDAQPRADFWVGLEGGLERLEDRWLASAWMAVFDARGRMGLARTPTLPLPPAVEALLDEGLELGEANDRVFATHNSKQKGGAFGLLTDGRMTRGGVYAQTLELAMIPLLHPLWD
jgi:inosine/xanthosine triphosphatase